jgi:hypothetical protein
MGWYLSQGAKARNERMELFERRIVMREGSIEGIVDLRGFCHDELRNAVRVWIPISISIVPAKLFHDMRQLRSFSFETNSGLRRIESGAFSSALLQSILIPYSVEILCSSCFSNCQLLSSISFESHSHLARIESNAFSYS